MKSDIEPPAPRLRGVELGSRQTGRRNSAKGDPEQDMGASQSAGRLVRWVDMPASSSLVPHLKLFRALHAKQHQGFASGTLTTALPNCLHLQLRQIISVLETMGKAGWGGG